MGGSFHQIIASTREEHLSISLYAQHTYWTNTVQACPEVSQAVWVVIDRKADMRLLLVAHLLLPGTLLAVGIWIEFERGQLVCPAVFNLGSSNHCLHQCHCHSQIGTGNVCETPGKEHCQFWSMAILNGTGF